MSPRAVVLACFALLLLSGWTTNVQAAKTLANAEDPANPLPCSCSDIDPRSYFTKADVQYSCYDQATFVDPSGVRNCDMYPQTCEGDSASVCRQFMRTTAQEISEGYCQISCGRCPCCKSLAQVLHDKGFNAYLWLLNLTDVGPALYRPGYMGTLIAASDSAVESAVKQLGYGSLSAARQDSSKYDTLRRLALLSVVPPVYESGALWTAPFFNNDVKLWTQLAAKEGAAEVITASRGSDGKIKLTGPRNSGWLYETDVFACKGYIQIIDTMLLP